ncbi:hypothetical protein SLEP1_g51196 [Rubroshorea leprosula]|uniref:Uncharacterized protein n=1 Tax=Rubroshorea leprosula TaxID=152421 RepID=A0AAV5M2N1_9ROSI|nr:hypothetical protein SLEP1_g51196 [Rubroshorea leprosula]
MNPDLDLEQRDMEEKRKEKGGVKTIAFILGNEICERMAMMGFTRNMVNYLTLQLHMPMTTAAKTVTDYNGTSSLTPLLGAFIADSYAGKFWTITVSSMIYLLGMIILTLSAALPQLRPPPCEGNRLCKEANDTQLWILFLSLLLRALGSGGIRPCVAAFGAEQFVEDNPEQTKKTWVYFNWFFFAMGAAMLMASTVLVYIQDNVGWGWGLGIPTIAMALSIVVFLEERDSPPRSLSLAIRPHPFPSLSVRHLQSKQYPAGSPFVRILQVIVAAFRKRKVPLVSSPELLFLDKAAIETEEDNIKSTGKPNLWRLNTIHRVEELKCTIRMLPIWAAGILFATATAQQSTFYLQQANTMNRHLSKSFQIPSASLSVFSMIPMLITIVIYDRLFVPIARKFTGLDRGINFLQRMAIGFFLEILATLVAGFIEVKRKHAAIVNGLIDSPKSIIPISVFRLVPQYALHGIAEAFMSIGHLEFFYSQAPESMRSTATALFWTASSVGDYVSSLLVSLVHKFSSGADGSNWLPDKNLNKGKLENFYWLITILQALNFVYYMLCMKFYTFKPLHSLRSESGGSNQEELELGSQV